MKNKLITPGLLVLVPGAGAGLHYRIPIVITLVCVGLALFSAVTGVWGTSVGRGVGEMRTPTGGIVDRAGR